MRKYCGIWLLLIVSVQWAAAQGGNPPDSLLLAEDGAKIRTVSDIRIPAEFFAPKIHPVFLEQPGTVYAIQIGAFTNRENAVKMSRRMGMGGYRADVLENLIDGKQLLYLVWVGAYRSMDDVMKTLVAIRADYHIDGVVRERSICRR